MTVWPLSLGSPIIRNLLYSIRFIIILLSPPTVAECRIPAPLELATKQLGNRGERQVSDRVGLTLICPVPPSPSSAWADGNWQKWLSRLARWGISQIKVNQTQSESLT